MVPVGRRAAQARPAAAGVSPPIPLCEIAHGYSRRAMSISTERALSRADANSVSLRHSSCKRPLNDLPPKAMCCCGLPGAIDNVHCECRRPCDQLQDRHAGQLGAELSLHDRQRFAAYRDDPPQSSRATRAPDSDVSTTSARHFAGEVASRRRKAILGSAGRRPLCIADKVEASQRPWLTPCEQHASAPACP